MNYNDLFGALNHQNYDFDVSSGCIHSITYVGFHKRKIEVTVLTLNFEKLVGCFEGNTSFFSVTFQGLLTPTHLMQEFLMSQGKNAKLAVEFKANLSDILGELAFTMEKKQISPKSAMAADLVTVGDSWLATAVQGGLIDPIPNAEQFDWFKQLHPKWQV